MTSAQSWAAWLLDSYASSISPVATDFRHHDDGPSSSGSSHSSSTSHSSTRSQMSPISNSSPYGPYARSGRGGAGNFTWQTDLKPVKSSPPLDLEAQPIQQTSLSERRKAAAKLEHIDTQEAVRLRQSSTQYLSVGRGGAGNYNTNTELKRSPSLPMSFGSTKSGSPTDSHSAHPGRGGAGNYAAAAEANGQKETEREQEERLAAEQMREQIVEEVDGLLQPPPGAWLGSGRRKSESMYDYL